MQGRGLFLSCAILSIIILDSMPVTTGYFIHDSCKDYLDLEVAASEAIEITEYALFRFDKPPDPGPVVEVLIGPGARGANGNFLRYMRQMNQRIGVLTNAPDEKPLIMCSDHHFVQNPQNPRTFIDPNFPNMRPLEPSDKETRLCGSHTMAFTYATRVLYNPVGPSPTSVIVLCDTPETQDSILKESNIIGLEWKDTEWEGVALDVLEGYLATNILHEFMHASDLDQFPRMLEQGKNEVYGWDDIKLLREDLKARNADGYSLLATALYMRHYPIGADGKFGPKFEIQQRPEAGNHPTSDSDPDPMDVDRSEGSSPGSTGA